MNSNIEEIYKLTPLQEGMAFMNYQGDSKSEYYVRMEFELSGSLNLKNVRESFDYLAYKYSVLRTAIVFPKTSDIPWQVVLKDRKIELNVIDIQHLDENEKKKRISEVKTQDLNRGFDLQKDSLFRTTFIRIEAEKYYVLWGFHHIIMDGWCNSIILADFIRYYQILEKKADDTEIQSLVENEKRNTLRFSDYVKWLDSCDKDSAATYWKNILEGYTSVAEIPSLGKNVRGSGISNLNKVITKETTNRLVEICKKYDLTMSVLIETALGLLLQQYNNTDDVVFGKVVSGRNVDLYGIEQAVGLFINTIPVRVKKTDTDTFLDLVKMIQKNNQDGLRYDHYSLSQIQNASLLKKGLFEVIYGFENYFVNDDQESELDYSNLSVRMIQNHEETNYPIVFMVSQSEELLIHMQYNSERYSLDEAGLVLDHLEIIIERLLDVEAKINEMSFVSEAEELKIINEFSGINNKVNIESENVKKLFEEIVDKYPDSIAVKYGEKKQTYRELNSKANTLAKTILDRGGIKEKYIAIISDKCIDMIVAMFAAIKCGMPYVPIDSAIPADRINFMIEDCNPQFIITHGCEYTEKDKVIRLEEIEELEEAENPNIAYSMNNLMYLIYTSGTTGRPKGVMIEHRGILNLNRYFETEYQITHNDNIIQFANISFDASVWEIMMALLSGATLHIVDKSLIGKIDEFNEYISTNNISVATLPPQYYLQTNVKGLRLVITAGSEATKTILENLAINCRYVNAYGPTENTVCASWWEYDNTMEQPNIIPIGRPIGNQSLYILNNKQIAGIGVPGELCVSGIGVARGYLNNQELTRNKFIDNPFGAGKLYCTGDLVKWDLDGNIIFLGRMDDQVKINGYRIELGEIEYWLRRISNVEDAAVIIEQIGEDKRLHGFLVSDNEIDIKQVKDFLNEKLVSYMVPSKLTQIDEIPVNRNGKIDKDVLIKKGKTTSKYGREAKNELEKKLLEIYCEVLKNTEIGVTDDFFEMGGHSLRAMVLVNRVEAYIGKRVEISDIFKYPTVEALAEHISTLENLDYERMPKAKEKEFYPMSAQQKRTFLLCQLEKDSMAYNMPYAMEIDGEIDPALVEKAFLEIIARHEILRTQFKYVNGEAVQIIHSTSDFKVEVEEASINTIEDRQNLISNFSRAFNFDGHTWLRTRIVKNKNGKDILLLDIHHIVSDGMSIGLLIKEFAQLYDGVQLTPVEYQYKDYSEWINNRDISQQEKYWLNEYESVPDAMNLPTDYGHKKSDIILGKKIDKVISKNLYKKIQNACSITGVTEYMFMLSALYILLNRYTGEKDIVIGSPVSGRVHKDTEKIMGMFINTLAIRTNIDENTKVIDLLQNVKEKCLGAFENQEYPFEQLISKVVKDRDMSQNPLFDVMFVFQNNEKIEIKTKELGFKEITNENLTAKVDLSFEINMEKNDVVLSIEYASELFNDLTIKYMYDHYLNILTQISENNEIKIRDISVVNEKEAQLLLSNAVLSDELNDYNQNVISRIDEQCNKLNDSIAVIANGKEYSYREIYSLSNALAKTLMIQGVKEKTFVAIYARRTVDIFITMIAILRLGAAYIPIDPDIPTKRLEYILDDSKCETVIISGVEYEDEKRTVINLKTLDYAKAINAEECINKIESLNQNCYMIYTSGSTGLPKGVLLSHGNVANYCDNNEKNVYGGLINSSENSNYKRIVSVTTMAFDIFVTESLLALSNGMSIVLADDYQKKSPKDINELVVKYGVEVMQTTPSTMKLYLMDEDNLDFLKQLKLIMLGGEKYDKNIHLKLRKYTDARLVNIYGPTETTVWSTFNEMQDEDEYISIGRPIANTQIYVLNELQLSGFGMCGELCIGGAGVSKGYWMRENLTKEKFIDNPFGAGKIYRTGDIARWHVDGKLECLGRKDDQVKIHGYRIELGEIENVIRESGLVEDAVVITDCEGDNVYLAAYVVADTIDLDKLKSDMEDKLPAYMVPQHIMQIASIPMNQNNKVDKSALPHIRLESNKDYIAPENEIQQDIVDVYAKVLKVDRVGINDNFFELGGDSMSAMALASVLSEKYNVDVKDVFLNPSVRSLETHISSKNNENLNSYNIEDSNELQTLDESEVESLISHFFDDEKYAFEQNSDLLSGEVIKSFDLSPIQKMHLKSPESIVYGYDISNSVKYEDIEKAIFCLIDNQDLLRAKIVRENRGYRWKVYKSNSSYKIPSLDMTIYSLKTINNISNKLIGNYMNSDIPAINNLGYRIILIKKPGNRLGIIIAVNHVVADLLSVQFMIQQIMDNYAAITRGESVNRSQNIDYETYVDMVNKGPQNITEESLIEELKLNEYVENSKKITTALKNKRNQKKKGYSVAEKVYKKELGGRDWYSLALKVVDNFCKDFFDIDKVSLTLTTNGRLYQDKSFHGCVGDFVDRVPLVLDELSEEAIQEKIKFYSEHNINIATLAFNKKVGLKNKSLFLKIAKIFMKPSISVNYQGEVSETEFEKNVEDYFDEDKISNIKDVTFIIRHFKDEMKIIIVMPIDVNADALIELL